MIIMQTSLFIESIMQTKERIFHAVSFEILATAIIVPVSAMLICNHPLYRSYFKRVFLI
ncbi:chlorhexidine efflux transporter [Shewanella sp. A14]